MINLLYHTCTILEEEREFNDSKWALASQISKKKRKKSQVKLPAHDCKLVSIPGISKTLVTWQMGSMGHRACCVVRGVLDRWDQVEPLRMRFNPLMKSYRWHFFVFVRTLKEPYKTVHTVYIVYLFQDNSNTVGRHVWFTSCCCVTGHVLSLCAR